MTYYLEVPVILVYTIILINMLVIVTYKYRIVIQ